MTVCELNISADQWADIQKAEAVVIRECESGDRRWGAVMFIGDKAEADDVASTRYIFVVPDHVTYLGDIVVATSDLLPPAEVAELSR